MTAQLLLAITLSPCWRKYAPRTLFVTDLKTWPPAESGEREQLQRTRECALDVTLFWSESYESLPAAGPKTVNMMTKRKKRHPPEQIAGKIRQADRILAEGGDVAAVLRELNVTETTYFRWCSHYGGLKADDVKNLKQWEEQNLQLTKLLAAAELEKTVWKEWAGRNL